MLSPQWSASGLFADGVGSAPTPPTPPCPRRQLRRRSRTRRSTTRRRARRAASQARSGVPVGTPLDTVTCPCPLPWRCDARTRVPLPVRKAGRSHHSLAPAPVGDRFRCRGRCVHPIRFTVVSVPRYVVSHQPAATERDTGHDLPTGGRPGPRPGAPSASPEGGEIGASARSRATLDPRAPAPSRRARAGVLTHHGGCAVHDNLVVHVRRDRGLGSRCEGWPVSPLARPGVTWVTALSPGGRTRPVLQPG